MEFRLFYRGRLKGNGGPVDKQKIRRYLHPQLQTLWQQHPLKDHQKYLDPSNQEGPDSVGFLRQVANFTFVPLVNEKANLVADANLVLLRPEPPGSIVTQTGDVDNRLKTFLDALRMPQHGGELPAGDAPGAGEQPFFCLLEDDNLITQLSVITDRLLVSVEHQLEVVILLHVNVKVTRATFANLGIGLYPFAQLQPRDCSFSTGVDAPGISPSKHPGRRALCT